jgi:hypothetical protein
LDVLQCPTCKGRREVIAAITEPEAIRKILRCLGYSEDPPGAAPARPLGDPGFEFDQAGQQISIPSRPKGAKRL